MRSRTLAKKRPPRPQLREQRAEDERGTAPGLAASDFFRDLVIIVLGFIGIVLVLRILGLGVRAFLS